MEYRELNKDYKPSLLGFGCMRFPLNEDGSIDEVEAERILDKAIAGGVTYIDTAFPYHDGKSEPFLGRVLQKYDRTTYQLATKLPMWDVQTLEEAKVIFEDQMQRLNQEYVDFYLLHAINKEKWELVKKLGIIEYCEELQAQGRIRNFGFSFHDEYTVFEEIITYRKWDFCQIQYNYIDTDKQAGDAGYQLAEKLHVPLIIMEPIKGGFLSNLPKDVASMMKNYDANRSISSWAMRWVGSKENVKVILSGMSTYEQVVDNLATFTNFIPLNKEENEIVEKAAATIKERTKNGCTGCSYCMPCPFGVNIPTNFKYWNEYSKYGDVEITRRHYQSLTKEEMAGNCQQCGKCETLCPQAISIRKDLAKVSKELSHI